MSIFICMDKGSEWWKNWLKSSISSWRCPFQDDLVIVTYVHKVSPYIARDRCIREIPFAVGRSPRFDMGLDHSSQDLLRKT